MTENRKPYTFNIDRVATTVMFSSSQFPLSAFNIILFTGVYFLVLVNCVEEAPI